SSAGTLGRAPRSRTPSRTGGATLSSLRRGRLPNVDRLAGVLLTVRELADPGVVLARARRMLRPNNPLVLAVGLLGRECRPLELAVPSWTLLVPLLSEQLHRATRGTDARVLPEHEAHEHLGLAEVNRDARGNRAGRGLLDLVRGPGSCVLMVGGHVDLEALVKGTEPAQLLIGGRFGGLDRPKPSLAAVGEVIH